MTQETLYDLPPTSTPGSLEQFFDRLGLKGFETVSLEDAFADVRHLWLIPSGEPDHQTILPAFQATRLGFHPDSAVVGLEATRTGDNDGRFVLPLLPGDKVIIDRRRGSVPHERVYQRT